MDLDSTLDDLGQDRRPHESGIFLNGGVPSSHGDTSRRAFRRSCDRCYSQKLKCTQNEGTSHNRCMRCQKARLQCSYSIRFPKSSSKKTSSSVPQRNTPHSRQQSLPSPGPSISPISSKHTSMNLTPLSDFDPPSIDPFGTMFLDEAQQDQGWSWRNWDRWTGSDEKSLFQPDGDEVVELDLGDIAILQSPDSAEQRTEHVIMPATTHVETPLGNLLEDLTNLSRTLESFFDDMEKSNEDIDSYPIGEALEGSKKLLTLLQQHEYPGAPKHDSSPLNSGIGGSLYKHMRTTDALLALHCYIICVKILAMLCKKLLAHLSTLSKSTRPTSRPDSMSSSKTLQSLESPRPEERPNDAARVPSDITLRTGLCLNDLYSHVDPLGHALNCVYIAWSAGMHHLKSIEVVLMVPQELRVSFEASTKEQTPKVSELRTPDSATAEIPDLRRPDLHSDHWDGGNDRDRDREPSFSARLLVLLWDEEDKAQNSENALVLLRRCSKEIHRLSRQHVSFSSRHNTIN